uniref:Uncharacterized protein n=1 Tax=viral metagenome TaxID=1070528 RepID=A0A6C0BI99_9ZZZZ
MASFAERFYVLSSEDVHCGCCGGFAMDNDSVWRCHHGSWIVTDSPTPALAAMRRAPPQDTVCLFKDDPEQVRLFAAESNGELWGDILYDALSAAADAAALGSRLEDMRVDASEQRMREYAARKAKALSDRAAAEASQLARQQGMRAHDARKMAAAAAASAQVQKLAEPCKWLYCPPGSTAVFGAKVVSECWGHEYRNPKTGKFETPHKCDRAHPGETGWLAEWAHLARPRNQVRFNSRPHTPVMAAGRDFGALLASARR